MSDKNAGTAADTVWEGRYISVHKQGSWEYAARRGAIDAAVILAVDDGHLLLVEQFRIPLGQPSLELPAGLVGDEEEGEMLEVAAARELEEETGYRPAHVERLGAFASSPGMTAERFTLVRATGLTRTGKGGGVEGENITVHRVPLADLHHFVAERRAAGVAVDAKMLAVLAPSLT